MTDKELRKLKKIELLEILVSQSREIDSLREQLEKATEELKNRKIVIAESGTLAEASMRLFHIFEDAQKAADLYLENIKMKAGGAADEQEGN